MCASCLYLTEYEISETVSAWVQRGGKVTPQTLNFFPAFLQVDFYCRGRVHSVMMSQEMRWISDSFWVFCCYWLFPKDLRTSPCKFYKVQWPNLRMLQILGTKAFAHFTTEFYSQPILNVGYGKNVFIPKGFFCSLFCFASNWTVARDFLSEGYPWMFQIKNDFKCSFSAVSEKIEEKNDFWNCYPIDFLLFTPRWAVLKVNHALLQ